MEDKWKSFVHQILITSENELTCSLYICLFILVKYCSYILNTKNMREDTYNFNFPLKKFFLQKTIKQVVQTIL